MTPRPAELPESPFDPALRAARGGAFAQALDLVLGALAERGARETLAAPAANALGEIARSAEAAGELGVAERSLGEAVALKPGYADFHHARACLLLRGGRRPEARRALESALAINPRYVAARLELALLDARDGMVGEALESLRGLAGGIAVGEPRVFQQGIERLEHADWNGADALLRRALHVQDAALQGELGEVRARMDEGRVREAVQALRAMLPRFAVYPDLHALLGRAQLALGHHDDAVVSLCRALELHPGYHGARVLLAHALESAGQLDQAQEQISLVLQEDPAHADALERRREWSRRGSRPAPRSGAAR